MSRGAFTEADVQAAVNKERERCYDIVARAAYRHPSMTQEDIAEFGSVEAAWDVCIKAFAFDVTANIRGLNTPPEVTP